MSTARLRISGMSCGHCKASVERALRSQPGVREARVDLEAGSAEVDYDPAMVGAGQLVAAVEGEGYEASVAA